MDKNQHQELEINRPVQNRDRSRRSRSKLSSALEYGESQQPFEASDEQSPERAVARTLSPGRIYEDILSPGRAVTDILSPGRAVTDILSPGRAVTDILSPGRAASAHSIERTDQKKNIFRNSSKSSSQVHGVPKPHILDTTSGIGSPEPSLFATANRVGISPLPFRATPLPPIKSSQDKESKQQELDTKLEIGEDTSNETETWEEQDNKFQADRKKKEEERQKAGKEISGTSGNIQPVKGRNNKTVDSSQEQNSATESHANHMADLPSHGQRQVPLPAPRIPHPPSRPKGNIVVRETKASQLRKKKWQSEKPVETQKLLLPVKAPVKLPTRASIGRAVAEVSRSSSDSESQPPTPIELEPSRPAFVPKLDLSFLLSPENNSKADPIPLAPRDIVIRETKASKLLRLKKLEDEKLAKRKAEEERVKDMTFGQPLGEKTFLGKRSPTQTFKPAPPKPYKKTEPVVMKETRASKLRKLREVKEEGNKGPPTKNKRLEGSQPSQQRLNMEISTGAKEIDPSLPRQVQDKEKIRNGIKRAEKPIMARRPLQNGPENTAKNKRVPTPVNARDIRESNSESIQNSIITSRQSPPKPIAGHKSENQASIDVTKAIPFELKEDTEDKERERIDKSARNKLCRKETARALKVRKAVRLAMEEDEKRWQSELMREFQDIEGPFVFGKPDDNNREVIRQALDYLKEQLEEAEAADKSGSKSKVKSCLKSKEKAEKDEKVIENTKKVREEKIDGYFRGTVRSLNSVLGDIWERFIYQQDSYREMLEKITLQEEILNKWKSEARHYRFMHTMLKQDYLGDRKDSWYL